MKKFAAAIGCLAIGVIFSTASAAAAPVGLIEEFDVGGWAFSLTPGPGGDVWFTFDRDPVRSGDTAIGRIGSNGKPAFYRSGLDPRSAPGNMVPGPDGNLWFTDHGKRPAIGRVTPQGTIVEFRSGLDPGSKPGSIVPGPDGNLWFTDGGKTPAIGRITPSGEITEFSSGLASTSVPSTIVAGPDGALWFGNAGSSFAFGRITTAGEIATFGSGPQPGFTLIGPPVPGLDGNIWFTAGGKGSGIGRITPSGEVSVFGQGLSPVASLLGPIAAGPDGNIWFAARGDGPAIGRVTPSGEIAEYTRCLHRGALFTGPNSIAAGPDGNVWFTSLTTRSLPNIGTPPAIGRITPSGEITEFRAGMVYASSPDGIVSGPDGALWFTDRERGSIGRLVPPKAPPNTFIVRPTKPARRNGAVTVPVAVPGPGLLTLELRGLLSFRNRLTRIDDHQVAIATAPACGDASIPLRLRGVALERLRRYGSIRLKARVSFTPAEGSTYTEAVTIGIGLRRR